MTGAGRGQDPVRVDRVLVDQRQGHITCGALVLLDLGPWLQVDAWQAGGARMDVPAALDLADALAQWANRARPGFPTVGRL